MPTTATSTFAAAGPGERVMASVTSLPDDAAEAQGQRVEECGGSPGGAEVPGLQLHERPESKRRIAPKALDRFKDEVRELTRRTRGVSLEQMIERRWRRTCMGWRGYFGFCETPERAANLDALGPIATASGAVAAVEHTPAVVGQLLLSLGVRPRLAAQTAGSVTVPGESREPGHARRRCPMHTSTRSAFRD